MSFMLRQVFLVQPRSEEKTISQLVLQKFVVAYTVPALSLRKTSLNKLSKA